MLENPALPFMQILFLQDKFLYLKILSLYPPPQTPSHNKKKSPWKRLYTSQ